MNKTNKGEIFWRKYKSNMSDMREEEVEVYFRREILTSAD